MVVERSPSKAPAPAPPLQNIASPNTSSQQAPSSSSQSSQFSYTSSPARARQTSPDSDDDLFDLLSSKGFASLKSTARGAPFSTGGTSSLASIATSSNDSKPSHRGSGGGTSGGSSLGLDGAATESPTFGHPTKMMSSRKQKADVFIRQKTRPEHHGASKGNPRGAGPMQGQKMSIPRGPMYEAKKPPPMQVYDSKFFTGNTTTSYNSGGSHSQITSRSGNVFSGGAGRKYDQERFYTDPEKAQAELKDLLEGGLGEDEEAEDVDPVISKDVSASPPAEAEKSSQEVKNASSAHVPKPSDTNTLSDDDQRLKEEAARKARRDGTVEGLKVKLLPHQVAGVRWMRGRELGPVKQGKVPKGGILADDMGLGKTLQTVSLLLTNRKPAKDDASYKPEYDKIEKTTLVVAPLALIRQWESEMKTKVEKATGLKILVHHGPQRTKRFKDLALYDVVITTYQILVSEHGASSDQPDGLKAGCFGLRWWRVVLDEAHTIKNRNAKGTKACYALRSEYRWCLTGTPMQNNLDELQSLIKFLRIRPYDDYREWKQQIDQPMKQGKGHIAIQRIHSLLHCFMKRRTKEILKKDGALTPGGVKNADEKGSSNGFKVTERKIVTIATELSAAERKFYDRVEARANDNVQHMMNNKVNYASAFTLLLRLRQACNHPKLVEGKLDRDKEALTGRDPTSKKADAADVDGMMDMFASMGIAMRECTICGTQLSKDQTSQGDDHCGDCAKDLEYFHNPNKADKKSKACKHKPKKAKVKEIKKQVKVEKPTAEQKSTKRKPRNRNAVVDSDDEEGEGSWLVPEGERGDEDLGKAGGEEDENAEGGGDTILSEARSDRDDDDKDLSGFVVDDETARKEKGYKSMDEASDDDDSLLSISALTQKMASQTIHEDEPSIDVSEPSVLDSEEDDISSDASSDEDSSSDSSGIEASELYNSGDNLGHGSSTPSRLLASAKIRELVKILDREVTEHKFIVFSQFTSMLDLVEPFLHKQRFRFTRYDGSMRNEDREESLRRLREDKKTRILLCSLKCGSLGLNLTAATRVVILEPFWNPFVEEQAIDRVHRLTQTIDVVVYKITAARTVEEGILALQEKKRLLAQHAIEGAAAASDRKGGMNLDLNELLALFKPGAARVQDELGDGTEDPWAASSGSQSQSLLRRY